MANNQPTQTSRMKRLLKLVLKHGPCQVRAQPCDSVATIKADERDHDFSFTILSEALEEGLIAQANGEIEVTSKGKSALRRLLHGAEQEALRSDWQEVPSPDDRSGTVTVNTSESPLARLFLRGQRKGEFQICEDEFAAGERLRADFERARLQPRISANWEAGVSGRGRSVNEAAELSDFAVDARKRVNQAVSNLGPELSGVALDVCCFLKGLQVVERERKWPPRSAKLMLKAALGILADHYGLRGRLPDRKSRIHTWHAEGYRPELHAGQD